MCHLHLFFVTLKSFGLSHVQNESFTHLFVTTYLDMSFGNINSLSCIDLPN